MTSTAAHRRARKPPEVNGVPTTLRVAIYARKSTEKGLEQQFNSIDAQVAAVRAYVASQQVHGWVTLPEPYVDGGYSGATTDRPAFRRLLDDVRDGRVDVVAVLRLDRLSRSVADFMGLLQLFERHGVKFVSVSEHFDTSTPMGRFALGIMIQVAQLEREVISERISGKMAAARAQGLWQGGRPPLGLDVVDGALVPNEREAAEVRTIFETFLRLGSLVATLAELERRGLRNKAWRTQKGRDYGGSAFDANSLRTLLRNPLLAGRMWAGDAVVPAQHPAVVPVELFDAVQAALDAARTDRSRERRPSGALLAGIFTCARCGGGMVPHYAQKGGRRWAYYVCATQKRRGAAACPGTRVPLGPMEASVVERLRAIGKDKGLQAAVVRAAREEASAAARDAAGDIPRLEAHARRARAEHGRLLDALAAGGGSVPSLVQRAEEAEREVAAADAALADARGRLAAARDREIDEDALRAALATFEVWDVLFPAERARVLRLLVEHVEYDAQAETVAITFRPGGVAELACGNTPQPRSNTP